MWKKNAKGTISERDHAPSYIVKMERP
jgi:hypothetical protein